MAYRWGLCESQGTEIPSGEPLGMELRISLGPWTGLVQGSVGMRLVSYRAWSWCLEERLAVRFAWRLLRSLAADPRDPEFCVVQENHSEPSIPQAILFLSPSSALRMPIRNRRPRPPHGGRLIRRGGRVVECTGLLNRRRSQILPRVRIPPLPLEPKTRCRR